MLGLRKPPEPTGKIPVRPGAAPPPQDLRILLADDHPVQSQVTLALLQSLGYSADTVRNGQEALYALEKRDYDVVLMDVQMPVMNGYEATAEIRRRWPKGRQPRIIALTGRNLEQDRREALAAGMDDYIGKPVPLRVLAAKLANRVEMVVNDNVLLELEGATSQETVKELIDAFLGDISRVVREMRAAVSAGDGQTLRNLAHPEASVCLALGIARMAMLAKQLEKLGESGKLDGAAELLDDFEALMTPVETDLRRFQKR